MLKKLANDEYRCEREISQGILLPILHSLGWNVFNTDEVIPEYKVSNRRVDYALSCRADSRPSVFIEVKQPGGNGEYAERQLFEYAFHMGVPFAILTDGKTWSFFLPTAVGPYSERMLYKLDITEKSISKINEILTRYLLRDRIKNGLAFKEAQQEFDDRALKNNAKAAIPNAWVELLNNEDDALISLVSDKVADFCSYSPERDDVISFLKSQFSVVESEKKNSTGSRQLNIQKTYEKISPKYYFQVDNEIFKMKSGKDVVVSFLKYFNKKYSWFLKKCYDHPKNKGSSRVYIGRTYQELNKNRPDLAERFHCEFVPGWFLMTNANIGVFDNVLKMCRQVLGNDLSKNIKYKLK